METLLWSDWTIQYCLKPVRLMEGGREGGEMAITDRDLYFLPSSPLSDATRKLRGGQMMTSAFQVAMSEVN